MRGGGDEFGFGHLTVEQTLRGEHENQRDDRCDRYGKDVRPAPVEKRAGRDGRCRGVRVHRTRVSDRSWADEKRSSGRFSRHFETTLARPNGTPGAATEIGSGSSLRIAAAVSTLVDPPNGR